MPQNKEPLYWISTKSGKHIPIFDKDPQKNAQILKAQREAYLLNHPEKVEEAHVEPFTRMKTHLASKGIHSEEEIANYLRGLSATRRSKLAREMQLESRGADKIKEMAHKIYNAGQNTQPAPEPKKTEPMKSEPPKKPEPPTEKVAKSADFNYPQYESIVGKQDKKDIDAVMYEMHHGNQINPNYSNPNIPQYKYHKNCALCTTAILFKAHGYDVEAMPRDKDHWRGLSSILEYDYDNPDNFLLGSAQNIWDNFAATRTLRKKFNLDPDKYKPENYSFMPRGSNAAARAIIDKATSWGHGAVAELHLDWKGTHSSHSVSVINNHGQIWVYDGQTNEIITGHAAIAKLLSRTIASHTQLDRVDNLSLKNSPGIRDELEKMIRARKR